MDLIEPTLPLLHPHYSTRFTWAGRTATVHCQRKESGSSKIHPDWFYLELPDGSYHEIQFPRLAKHLEHPPQESSCMTIARAFEKESDQSLEMLRELAAACGLG